MSYTSRKGATGALLDEYERAISELKRVIEPLPDDVLVVITDPVTTDENCRSIQTILSHVVHSGFSYATHIHNLKGIERASEPKQFRFAINGYVDDLTAMFSFTEEVLQDIPDAGLGELDEAKKMRSGSGRRFDTEQMMEHAIVHILRHRRQIERIIKEKLT